MAERHMAHGAHSSAADNPGVHHETTDVNIRAILMFGAGLIVVAIAVHIIVWGLFAYFNARESQQPQTAYPLATEQERRLPPEPRLQTAPREDLQNMRAGEDDLLSTYGWVDRNAGTVRIPIDEAMKLVLQRGLPARAPQPTR